MDKADLCESVVVISYLGRSVLTDGSTTRRREIMVHLAGPVEPI